MKPFLALRTDARGRKDVYDQGFEAFHEWEAADPLWTVTDGSTEVTLGTLGSMLAAALTGMRRCKRSKLLLQPDAQAGVGVETTNSELDFHGCFNMEVILVSCLVLF